MFLFSQVLGLIAAFSIVAQRMIHDFKSLSYDEPQSLSGWLLTITQWFYIASAIAIMFTGKGWVIATSVVGIIVSMLAINLTRGVTNLFSDQQVSWYIMISKIFILVLMVLPFTLV